VDEDAIRDAMILDGANPRDIADTLAEAKARKVAGKHPSGLVLGCDQILAQGPRIFAKAETLDEQKAWMKKYVNLCETSAFVERYSWFIGRSATRPHISLLGEDCTLTELGDYYASLPACTEQAPPGGDI
jgi:hypothetical protein